MGDSLLLRSLHQDCLVLILQQLDVKTLTQLAQTNRLFRALVNQPHVGYRKALQAFQGCYDARSRFLALCLASELDASTDRGLSSSLVRARNYYREHPDINFLELHDAIFQYHCSQGNVVLAQWFWRQSGDVTLLSSGFLWSCYDRNLEITQFLWRLSCQVGAPVDFHAGQEKAFRRACRHNRRATAEWLWQLGERLDSPIDLQAQDQAVFVQCCQRGTLRMAKWLWQLNGGFDLKKVLSLHLRTEIRSWLEELQE